MSNLLPGPSGSNPARFPEPGQPNPSAGGSLMSRVTKVPLRPMYHQSAFLAAGVPVFEIREAAGMTNMLIETAPLGAALAKTLADKPAVLMRGHGAVVVADTIPNVVGRSIYMDLNAQIQLQAQQLVEYAQRGNTITPISPEEAQKYAATDNYGRAWELWKKKAESKGSVR